MKGAIGVFDSGLGGLTVVREIRKVLPQKDIIYFGDLARVPYGSKSEEVVTRYAIEASLFLLSQEVDVIVVACNTASSVAIERLNSIFSVPFVGMISPVVGVLKRSSFRRIAVIGTERTIKTGVYHKKIKQAMPYAEVISVACPLFVPMIEAGIIKGNLCRDIVRFHLNRIVEFSPDVVLLGCTHYPIIAGIIQEVTSSQVLCCSVSAADEVRDIFSDGNKKDVTEVRGMGKLHIYVSDFTDNLEDMVKLFLGCEENFNIRRVMPNVLY